jgi:DNA-binding Xre family transcriptional regulator
MKQNVIKWHLKELMARHKVKGNDLANYMKVSNQAVSDLRNKKTMPRIDGDRLNDLCNGLNALGSDIQSPITPNDLIEYILDIEEIRRKA